MNGWLSGQSDHNQSSDRGLECHDDVQIRQQNGCTPSKPKSQKSLEPCALLGCWVGDEVHFRHGKASLGKGQRYQNHAVALQHLQTVRSRGALFHGGTLSEAYNMILAC